MAQLRVAEQTAGVKSSRLLRKLLKYSTVTKNHTKAMIADLSGLYRCINKDTGSVLWISDGDDALEHAEKLGFFVPELTAWPELQAVNSDVSDADVEGEGDTGEQAGAGDQVGYSDKVAPAGVAKQKVEESNTTTDHGAKSASTERSTSDGSNAPKSQAFEEREGLHHRHSALDESVANLDAEVSTFAAQKNAPPKITRSLQGSTSSACILLCGIVCAGTIWLLNCGDTETVIYACTQ
jgi:hypothetical protein